MMDKKVSVSFASYDPYEDWPSWEKHIGHIPFDRAGDFLRTIADAPRITNCCVDYINATYSNMVIAARGENAFAQNDQRKDYSIDNGKITISNLFDEDSVPKCIKHKNRQRNEIQKMHACANAMRAGKCTDSLMRKLAAMMYPEKYNNKQR